MSKVQFATLTTLLAVIALLELLPIFSPRRIAPAYDYRIEAPKDTELLSELNRIGGGGWELVFARRAIGGEGNKQEGVYELFFRRPR
jgi:hypothetical protein